MNGDPTRRALLGALLGVGVGATAVSPAAEYLDLAAPLSGRAWRGTFDRVPETVSSPYGDARVTYDEYHVPHVEADDETAAFYAVGFVHAADRLFQMDLVRRLMDGRLAAVVGEAAVDSDEFHVKMAFRDGARASRAAIAGTQTESIVEAYADGVNASIDRAPEPLEFGLLDYEPEPWSIVDTFQVGQQIAWGLTGSFQTLRREVLREYLGEETYRRLYEQRFDHGAPILREGIEGEPKGIGGTSERLEGLGGTTERLDHADGPASRRTFDPAFVDSLARHEPPPLLGSNHWAVSGEHTESGSPILAYDPHLTLMVPPVWYEQRVVVGDVDVRGATFPGVPFVIVGENRHGAWGFTNTGADVIDFYTYETDGDRYRYEGEWRPFCSETRTIEVAGGEDREVTVRKTVHGAYVDREVDGETRHVGVAWTGMTASREIEAIHEFAHATDVDEFEDALRKMDVPTQNALYVDDEEVYYAVTGRIPIRQVDGEVVRGDRVFDGSAGEAEWAGFEPFGRSSWEGFVPFEEKPGVRGAACVATANQRPADDPTYPIGQSYASGFRGIRIYERLDESLDERLDEQLDEQLDEEFGDRGDESVGGTTRVDRGLMESIQRDTLDVRARMLVPAILDTRGQLPAAADPWLDALAEWDYRMDRDSAAALAFHWFYEHFREATWRERFEEHGLDESWWPQEWVLVTLPPDDALFDGDRGAVMAEAMVSAVETIEDEGWAVYGDYHRSAIDHPFGEQLSALNYPRHPTDGSAYTVFNVHDGAGAGSSWRQISPMDGESVSVIPGGQAGSFFSDHYDDQLVRWADGEYKPMTFQTPDDGDTITFGRGEP